jgi:hypothetical protein
MRMFKMFLMIYNLFGIIAKHITHQIHGFTTPLKNYRDLLKKWLKIICLAFQLLYQEVISY